MLSIVEICERNLVDADAAGAEVADTSLVNFIVEAFWDEEGTGACAHQPV